jgi:hypothetical protein
MYLRCSVQDSPKTWKARLPLAELWYNSSYHGSICCSPFKALYGYDPNLGTNIPIPSDTSPTVTEVIEHREFHLQVLKQRLEQAQNRKQAFADKNRTDTQFSIGDQVLLKLQPYTQSSVANRPYQSYPTSSLVHTKYWRELVQWLIAWNFPVTVWFIWYSMFLN